MFYSEAFERAVDHAMLYEVGGHWKLTPEVEAGLIGTAAQRRAVGYVDDPYDAGGETKFGVAKNANPDLDITHLTWADAKAVYFDRYWIPGACERLPGRIAVLHFDGAVNHGLVRAKKFLQRAVGVPDDGIIGRMTLEAVNSQDPIWVCHKICDLRENFYRELVVRKPNQVRFLKGWLRRINEMRAFTTDPNINFD
jgi:lysozyme family protein